MLSLTKLTINKQFSFYLIFHAINKEFYLICEQIWEFLGYSKANTLFQWDDNRIDYKETQFSNDLTNIYDPNLTLPDILKELFPKPGKIIRLLEVEWVLNRCSNSNISELKSLINPILTNYMTNQMTSTVAVPNIPAPIQTPPIVTNTSSTININSSIQDLLDIVFEGDHITAVSKDGKGYVGIKSICNNLGIDATTQINKLKNDPTLSLGVRFIPEASGNGVNILLLDFIPAWLFSINPNKVNSNAAIKLLKYKEHLRDYIANYVFGKKEVIQQENEIIRSSAETYEQKVIQAGVIISGLLKQDINDNVAMYLLQSVQKNLDIDMFSIYSNSKLKELSAIQ